MGAEIRLTYGKIFSAKLAMTASRRKAKAKVLKALKTMMSV
jgi:hypothetical protein